MAAAMISVHPAVPAVSVVMTVYNAEAFLTEAIQSILLQTFDDFEFIIVNDGSTDGSLEILNSFQDPRIIVVSNEPNSGIVYSLNRGISMVRAELVARFDADDISVPSRLQQQVAYMQAHPEITVCSTRIQLIDRYGNPDGLWLEDVEATTPSKIRQMLPHTNCIAHPSVIIRSSVFKEFRYRDDLKLSEDWGLWLELLAAGAVIGKINEPLVNYRIHSSSFTQKANSAGAYGKILKFQVNYLISRIRRKKFTVIDFNVAFAFIVGLLKYPYQVYLRPFLSKVKIAIIRKPWLFLTVYQSIPELLKDVKVVFFFPYYHTGGAENVHLSIVESVNDSNPLVFFTGKSNDDAYLYDFNNHARCCDISNYTHFPFLSELLLKRIASCINTKQHVTVFGSNSDFIYRLLPLLNSHVRKVDLIHAFVHEHETGPERWSLPVVHLLDHRIFVSKQAMKQMVDFYNTHNIAKDESRKLSFIRNFTKIPLKAPLKPVPLPLEVVYIGRAGKEKRIALLMDVIRHFRHDKRIHFTLIGDVDQLVPEDLRPFVELPGMLHAQAMEKHLNAAHVLVLASSREGMPMVILEAMAHGVVPVSTAVGDVPEYLQENETGYLLPVHPSYMVVQTLIKRLEYLKADPAELQRVSQNAYSLASEQFSKSRFVESYRKILMHTDL